jgi:hypothetical protein
MKTTKIILLSLILMLMFIGLGFCIYYFGNGFVEVTRILTDYITMIALVISVYWIAYKIDLIFSFIPLKLILLNVGTISLLLLMYILYGFFKFSPSLNALSAAGFNVATCLQALSIIVDIEFIVRTGKKQQK